VEAVKPAGAKISNRLFIWNGVGKEAREEEVELNR